MWFVPDATPRRRERWLSTRSRRRPARRPLRHVSRGSTALVLPMWLAEIDSGLRLRALAGAAGIERTGRTWRKAGITVGADAALTTHVCPTRNPQRKKLALPVLARPARAARSSVRSFPLAFTLSLLPARRAWPGLCLILAESERERHEQTRGQPGQQATPRGCGERAGQSAEVVVVHCLHPLTRLSPWSASVTRCRWQPPR